MIQPIKYNSNPMITFKKKHSASNKSGIFLTRGILILLFLIWAFHLQIRDAAGAGTIKTNIRVIHATSGTPHMDPSLKDLGHELQSVFKYTAYRLISSKRLNIARKTTGTVSLPGGRTLEVMPGGMQNNRIRFSIRILKNGKQVFTTDILLRNRSSITIGGPGFKNGYLLFNISGRTE